MKGDFLMSVIVSKVLVVFIYIAIGFIAYRLHVFNDDSIKHLTAFILNITCPALMIYSVGGAELNRSIMFNTVFMLLFTYFFFIVMSVLAVMISRRLKGADLLDKNVYAFGMTTTNSGFMGFPISQSIFGPLVFYYMVIQNISLNLYIYTLGIWQLNYKTGQKGTKKSFREVVKPFINPLIVSAVGGTIILFAGINIPEYAMDIFKTVGDVTIPTSMILVGVQLGSSDLNSVLKSRKILFASIVNLIAFPALATATAMVLPVENIIKLTFILSVCFPSAAIGVAVSASEGRNSQLYAELVAATTLLSMITLPVWIMIVTSVFPI